MATGGAGVADTPGAGSDLFDPGHDVLHGAEGAGVGFRDALDRAWPQVDQPAIVRSALPSATRNLPPVIASTEVAASIRSGLWLPADLPWRGLGGQERTATGGVLALGAGAFTRFLEREWHHLKAEADATGEPVRHAANALLHRFGSMPVIGKDI